MSDEPLLRVVKGDPTTDEIAALVAVVAARRAGAAAAARDARRERPRPRWGAPSLAVRGPHTPGPGAWRAAALPR